MIYLICPERVTRFVSYSGVFHFVYFYRLYEDAIQTMFFPVRNQMQGEHIITDQSFETRARSYEMTCWKEDPSVENDKTVQKHVCFDMIHNDIMICPTCGKLLTRKET